MNKKFLSLFSFLLILLAAAVVWTLIPTQKDKESLEKMRVMMATQFVDAAGIQQERENVRKEMVAGPFFDRLHTIVISEKSLIEIDKKENGYDLIEKLSNVSYIQQESLEPRHMVRVINADEALYRHRDEKITADHVLFYRYAMPGKEIPKTFEGLSPLVRGSGDQLTVDLSGEKKYTLSRARGQIFEALP